MKPENLKSPFPWNKRHILVEDRVWYVPDRYEDFASFSFPGWAHPSFFNQARPIRIEYCSGNGAWIAEKAKEMPCYNWVAVERQFERVRKIWSKVKNFELTNLLAVCGEGFRLTHHYIPSESVDAVFINFPDPWPKNRHAKNRIVQAPFIEEMGRILQPGKELAIVTDDIPFSQVICNVLLKFKNFVPIFPNPFFVTDNPGYGTSYFEDLWRQQGKEIRYHIFRKI